MSDSRAQAQQGCWRLTTEGRLSLVEERERERKGQALVCVTYFRYRHGETQGQKTETGERQRTSRPRQRNTAALSCCLRQGSRVRRPPLAPHSRHRSFQHVLCRANLKPSAYLRSSLKTSRSWSSTPDSAATCARAARRQQSQQQQSDQGRRLL